jgi:Leucine-rich repeat (LRR) protein
MGLITFLDFQNSWGITTLTSFDGGNMGGLTELVLAYNPVTSFNVGNMSNLTNLSLYNCQLTSIDVTSLTSLTNLDIQNNQLTSVNVASLSSLTGLYLYGNPLTLSSNNQILQQLNQHGLYGGTFFTSNGRTAASNTDYNNLLNNLGWTLFGLDLQIVGNGRLRVRGVNTGI